MNSKLLILITVGGAALLIAGDQPKKENNEFEKLKAKVTLLEGRVAQLESRVLSLAQTPRASLDLPTLQLNSETAPPNVGEIEVNGLKIYKVPLSQTAQTVK